MSSKNSRRGFRGPSQRNKSEDNNKENNSDQQDDTNPVILAFKNYAKELDDKHDRNEKIFKLSRDITIESKRIIFLLHTIDAKKNNSEKVLAEAQQRLQALCDTKFLAIAQELDDLDYSQYAKAYSSGLQEFVEAYALYEYLNKSPLSDWEILQKKLNYSLKVKNETEDETPTDDDDKSNYKTYSCVMQPAEYMLGLLDVTGEIMRRCVNSLGSGDIETCFQCCKTMQAFYTGYLRINMIRMRDLSRKIYTLRQSVLKTENVCYNVKVRGGEAAKWGAMDSYGNSDKVVYEEDEGFY